VASVATGVREQIAGASKGIKRVKRIDRGATWLITAGGIFIILSVLFIFWFIFAEAIPLFGGAQAVKVGTFSLGPARVEVPTAVGLDEYQKYLYEVHPDAPSPKVIFYRLGDGARHQEFEIAGLAGAEVTVSTGSLEGAFVAAGSSDGRVALLQVRFRPVFEGQTLQDLAIEVRDRGAVTVDPEGRPVRDVSYSESLDGARLLAALLGPQEISLVRFDEEGTPNVELLRTKEGDDLTHVRLGRTSELLAATVSGRLYQWEVGDGETRLLEATKVSDAPITAIEYGLGGNTVIVGDENGALAAWFRARPNPDADMTLVKAHEFESQRSLIVSIGSSTRERSFVTGGADGSIVLRHLTSERTLLRIDGAPEGERRIETALITPRADGMLVLHRDRTLDRYQLSNPHPEFSWRAMLGKVWYESYSEPEYVWQSTGATDDFEPKMSLVPLVFGTIKATFYALLFAVPLAVMGALYTSQFMHPTLRARVKPTVEIMAALPSVVIGFIAGLWLASKVEAALVPVLLLVLVLPLFGTAGVLFWEHLPNSLRKRLRPGTEVFVIVPLLVLGGLVALGIGPWVERIAFAGDLKAYLASSLGLVYDQRNSLVVGLAMGFAVVPIIFTISEDAFSSVPQHLTAASLALGASRWQTATRVVLPTASPGIFSATMVGFGRAVGETMIVLMATGNTPLLDWSPFNGMRTLSANIAVEVPEAPYGGTLYRVLFLSAAVLFLMTFVVNTIAELVRQRLRDKYKAI
jgi:phosphate transport system permease protein